MDGSAFAGQLKSIAADGGLTFQSAEKSEAVAIETENLVRWGDPAPLKPQSLVVLADGGRLVTAADWSGGSAVRLQGAELVVLSDIWNEVHLPRNQVGGIVFAQRRAVAERERLAENVRKASHAGGHGSSQHINNAMDAVWLTNGDRLTGNLAALDRGSLTMRTTVGETTLPLSRVEAVVLASAPRLGQSRLLVGLRDGSALYAQALFENEGKKVVLETGEAISLTGGSLAEISAVQSLGGRFDYVSDIEPLDSRCVPYLDIPWPLVRDRNVLGEPLKVGGRRYWKGLGLHTAARVTCRFVREYQRFEATAAIDDAAKGRGSVVFGAHVLREGKWSEAFTSDTVRGGDAPLPVTVDLRDAQGLTLTVDYADRGDELDYANWLDARLVR